MARDSDEQPDIIRHTDRMASVLGAANAVSSALRDVLARTSRATLSVAGGRTMAAVIPELAAQALPWDRIDVTLVDERWVPPDHPDSNERQIRALFAPAVAVSIRGLFAAGLDPQDVMQRLAQAQPPDVVLLSMADDGHIGSLFPGDPANYSAAPYAIVHRPDHVRLTMTAKHLRGAQAIVLTVDGAAREQMLLSAPNHGSRPPVHHVFRPGTQVHVLR